MAIESKNQKFRRLAEKRVNTVLDRVRVLSNLSNTTLYNYTPQEVKRMFDCIEDAVKIAKVSFGRGERESKQKFTFD